MTRTATKAFSILMLACACATPSQMAAGPTVLGAEGEVKVADGPNGNTQVRVIIHHLADAAAVNPAGTVYVVWIQPAEGGLPQNVGQIQLDKDRVGKLEVVTPFKSFKVTVTSEPTSTATSPSSNPVLSTAISAKG